MFDSDNERLEQIQDEESNGMDLQLRNGLRAIPLPTIAPDFDAQVLARLSSAPTLWQRIGFACRSLKPAFAAGALSLPLCLALIAWSSQPPSHALNPAIPAAISARILPVDQALDRPDLTPATLRRISDDERTVHGRRGYISPDSRRTIYSA